MVFETNATLSVVMQVLSLQNKDETRKFKPNIIDAELAKDDLIPVRSKDCHRGKGIGCKLEVFKFTMYRLHIHVVSSYATV